MATAVAAVCALVPDALEQADALVRGLKSVSLAGRLQPSADCPRVWLDVGHNPHAAQAMAAALQDLRWRPVICVLGMLRDKDAVAVASILDEYVQLWHCAGLGGDRGRSGADLAQEVVKVSGPGRVRDFSDVASALAAALEATAGGGQQVLVFGSFVTVAEATTFLAANSQL
jgi:dihydrofolate synthase/folylpolyglutamate synthase